ncbi:FliA/WhiG family RNA polymerase sigma factor [bacterium BFN5]|nr:FliA/WhiG family RNA polymerase sigma factor [bacterium BFN5]QJW47244.1 FliA/WhiG family RNA polymerase sigma factor [bacterium BFN5]
MSEKSSNHISDINHLWIAYQQNKSMEIRELLIQNYLGLVRLVAGRLAIGLPQHVDKDDLISNGFFGLLDAIERFDPIRGIKFETYAVARIRGAILDAIRAQDWVPVSLRQKARQYEQAVAQLEHKLGRSAQDHEIADSLNISIDELNHLLHQLNAATVIPLEEFAKSEPVSNQQINPSHNVETEEIKNILAKSIEKLPEKEKLVVTLYYYEGLTLKEISLILKLSEARISQLHTKAVFRLRGSLSRIKSSLI